MVNQLQKLPPFLRREQVCRSWLERRAQHLQHWPEGVEEQRARSVLVEDGGRKARLPAAQLLLTLLLPRAILGGGTREYERLRVVRHGAQVLHGDEEM